MGLIYENGYFVNRDTDKAKDFFAAAMKNGHNSASKKYDALTKQESPVVVGAVVNLFSRSNTPEHNPICEKKVDSGCCVVQ